MTHSVPRTTLPVHGTTRYLRTYVEVVDGVLRWEMPRTLLGMIPLGSRRLELPVTDLRSIQVRRVVPHPIRIALGVALGVLPWFFLPWWACLPLLVLGLWTILIALGPHLEVTTKEDRVHRAPICFEHSLDADLYKAAVEDMISPGPTPDQH